MKTNMKINLSKMVICALCIALAYLLAYVKIPGTTIALDSLPGFLGALLLGPWWGAAIGALGHMFSAILTGFPYTLPVHILTALLMGVCMLCFGLTYRALFRKNRILANVVAGIVAVLINGPLDVLVLSPFLLGMMGGWAPLIAFCGVLTIASAVNVAIALVVYVPIAGRLPRQWRPVEVTKAQLMAQANESK
jgi:uncharacterized membrane protein